MRVLDVLVSKEFAMKWHLFKISKIFITLSLTITHQVMNVLVILKMSHIVIVKDKLMTCLLSLSLYLPLPPLPTVTCTGVYEIRKDQALDVCWRLLTYSDVCWRMLTYADVCWRMQAFMKPASTCASTYCFEGEKFTKKEPMCRWLVSFHGIVRYFCWLLRASRQMHAWTCSGRARARLPLSGTSLP